jgi:hypothetical protein
MLLGMNFCTKDNLISDDSKTALQKRNPDEDYPFVLSEAMKPYQYAIHRDDLPWLFEYMQGVFENHQADDESGYFIFSLSANMSRINYGVIVYNSDDYIPTNPDDNEDEGGGTCFAIIASKTFDNFKDAQAWATDQMKPGYTICISKDKKTYIVIVDDGT